MSIVTRSTITSEDRFAGSTDPRFPTNQAKGMGIFDWQALVSNRTEVNHYSILVFPRAPSLKVCVS